jgi:hypothetical protein
VSWICADLFLFQTIIFLVLTVCIYRYTPTFQRNVLLLLPDEILLKRWCEPQSYTVSKPKILIIWSVPVVKYWKLYAFVLSFGCKILCKDGNERSYYSHSNYGRPCLKWMSVSRSVEKERFHRRRQQQVISYPGLCSLLIFLGRLGFSLLPVGMHSYANLGLRCIIHY